jgi:hypothetical protein
MERNIKGSTVCASDSAEVLQGGSNSEIIVYASDLTETEINPIKGRNEMLQSKLVKKCNRKPISNKCITFR